MGRNIINKNIVASLFRVNQGHW